MGSANDTTIDTSTGESPPASTAPGTEEIVSQLEDAGYEVTYRPGGVAPRIMEAGSVAFIELHISQEEVKQVEKLINKVDPEIPHRKIGPEDTIALPDWPNTSETNNDGNERPLYIIPSPHPTPSREQKAHHRASSL